MIITGQSIAAAADSVTRNGEKNTAIGWGLIVFGGCIFTAFGLGLRHLFKEMEMDAAFKRKMELEKRKLENRLKELTQKDKLKKGLIDYRQRKSKGTSDFNPNATVDTTDENASVATYDDLVAGELINNKDLRLGVRHFHIGEDCGLVGRTQIGKTSWLLHFAIAIARGYQEDGAILSPDWSLKQPMRVLYFAFEQNRGYIKTKYGNFIKSVPNLHIEVKTSAFDFQSMQKKIVKMQNEIGDCRLLVIFDNITKMKSSRDKDGKRAFFQWLEAYRVECESKGVPITYIKAFHTQGSYKDYMPLDPTSNYGLKEDMYYTQDLVGFGMCKGGDGRTRYIKELKNKLENDGEKQALSIYRFADTDAPMFDYVKEAEECDVLPSKAELARGQKAPIDKTSDSCQIPGKRGPKELYTDKELMDMYEEKNAGFTWKEILESRGIKYSKNKARGIREALKRHEIGK